MKTLTKGAFFLLSATLVLTTARAQSVDEIVSKHLTALGGKSLIAGIKTVVVESSVDVMGTEAPSTTYIMNGKGYKSEVDFNGVKIIQCVTDSGGWTINPMAGSTTATPLPEEQARAQKSQLQVGGPLFDYATNGSKVELIGKDSSNYKLRLTTKDGFEVTYFIDMKTYLINKAINKMSAGGQDLETTITFADYKKTDYGYVMPYSQSIVLPQVTLAITNKKIDINKEIDPAIFKMPK